MKLAEVPPIFYDCCTDDPPLYVNRFDFSKPYVRGGYIYATNGCICVRVKTDEPDQGDGPPCETLPWNQWPKSDLIALPQTRFVGSVKGSLPTQIGAAWIGSYYACLLRYHGVTHVEQRGDRTDQPFFFELGEIEGQLMPCRGGPD